MTNQPPRPVAPPLPLLEDPDHPGLFVVRRIGILTFLLVAALGSVMLLAGSLVRLTVAVPDAVPPRTESITLGTYVLRQLGHARLPGPGGGAR
ncbi:hypothetical protein D7X74_14695 [Corallococcus sp. CA047B]|uniref:hypothetical protein n=1 Tax=Corallococcus sp. CA047B TaxID=2316729 RepID=UPI000EA0D12F|nr:hypothetical protein [Corallococcus sp. CA047B]RKH16686.1 hypothetical protein D7X74_14695 [Corallococcus sp. CA047B]